MRPFLHVFVYNISMELRNKFIVKSLIGFAAGMLISVIISFASGYDGSERARFLLYTIGGGIYGAIAMGGSIAYDIESWSILRATLTHYLTTLVAFVIASLSMDWFPMDVMLYVWLAMTVIYAIIWLSCYFSWRRSIRRLNVELNAIKQSDSTEYTSKSTE